MSSERVDQVITGLARRQYGLVSRTQVFESGASGSLIDRRLAAERWERIHPGVYRIAGAPASWPQTVLAACLASGPDGLASHRTGARIWGLPGGRDPIEVSSTARPRLPGVIVHRVRSLPKADRATHRAIPVTTPTRTLIDLAAVVAAETVEEALDDALRRGLTSLPKLRWRLDELGRRGRSGVAVVRALLAARGPGGPVPESVFETRLLRLLRRAGLPAPVVQHVITDGGRFVARVDLAYPDEKLAIEADGYRHHGGRQRFEHDRARLNAITALGWRVILVTWQQMQERPQELNEQIARTLREGTRPTTANPAR